MLRLLWQVTSRRLQAMLPPPPSPTRHPVTQSSNAEGAPFRRGLAAESFPRVVAHQVFDMLYFLLDEPAHIHSLEYKSTYQFVLILVTPTLPLLARQKPATIVRCYRHEYVRKLSSVLPFQPIKYRLHALLLLIVHFEHRFNRALALSHNQ